MVGVVTVSAFKIGRDLLNTIFGEIRLRNDGDVWGTVQMARFDVCEVLWSQGVDPQGYEPSLSVKMGDYSEGARDFLHLFPGTGPLTPGQVRAFCYVLSVLDRARDVLVAMERDY